MNVASRSEGFGRTFVKHFLQEQQLDRVLKFGAGSCFFYTWSFALDMLQVKTLAWWTRSNRYSHKFS
jgi:hypothetical protein